ncbi:hypothetical protein [Luteolibacter sp. AS25]|uniref:hypothetical protein n=1 Tax=Luteolibacter sp. AS25 TaxID=3135776 RepID=UPI00398ADF0A
MTGFSITYSRILAENLQIVQEIYSFIAKSAASSGDTMPATFADRLFSQHSDGLLATSITGPAFQGVHVRF